jgi:nucleoside-triphosphatase
MSDKNDFTLNPGFFVNYDMQSAKKNILITGQPGIGKTTLIKKLSDELREFQPVGFYTAEMRQQGIRKGFELVSLSGTTGILSHTDIQSPYRVGRYRVNIKGFENFLDSISFLAPSVRLVIVDEIGKMECFSDRFRTLVKKIFDSEKICVATIAVKGDIFIAEIKRRDDVAMYEINEANRDSLSQEIVKEIKTLIQYPLLPFPKGR